MIKPNELIEKLFEKHSLSVEEYQILVENISDETINFAKEKANILRMQSYGNKIFLRGLIEIGNYCRNNCYYCGIRHDNKNIERYALTPEEILLSCDRGHDLGFHTFVMQSGENCGLSAHYVCKLIRMIKDKYPDCAVTLSLGEYPFKDYKMMKEAGADRYLLRHETADKEHYEKLHPSSMSFENRIRCLEDLKKLGFQTGCGFMVGSPYQTPLTIAKDLKFIEEFQPEMCGIGPFIPQKDTPFKDKTPGGERLTCYLLSLIRLIIPKVLLPSTTALNTISKTGRINGILSGANVVMPNLSPYFAREKYTLYNKKVFTDDEASENLLNLKKHMQEIGFEVDMGRGDFKDLII